MRFDIIVIGAGVAGACFAAKVSKHAKTLVVDSRQGIDSYKEKINLFVEHNKPFVQDLDLNYEDKNIFSLNHVKSNFMSEDNDGIIDSTEFGKPLGKIIYTENLIKKLLEISSDNQGEIQFDQKVKSLERFSEGIKVRTTDSTHEAKLVILATGSRGFELQRSLGFDCPDRYMGVYQNYSGSEELLEKNFPTEYTFNINTKISKTGPFFINRGRNKISLGYLGNLDRSASEIKSKLERVVKSYKKIRPFLSGLKKASEPFIVNISKHPIKHLSLDRALVLGEAAGLVTSFFYEGIIGCVGSADIAAKTVKDIMEEGKDFEKRNLARYDEKIKERLLEALFRNGDASEYMFYNSGSSMKLLWESYIKLINKNQTLRKYIYEAHTIQDMTKYDIKRDRWTGEKIFSSLPTLSKITLGPKFLRAMFKL